ncbi:MAG: acetyltransferase [bacterium]|nr:acetyltransferase [bacterium]
MVKKLIIIGAGGHGRVLADIAKRSGYAEIYFLDDIKENDESVIGKVSDYCKYITKACFFVAIGDNVAREKIFKELDLNGAKIINLIHPDAVISEKVTIGKGTAVMAGAVINTTTVIGDGVIVNTCSSIDHDNRIADFTHISVGAHLCGTVSIGKNTMIGAGATVINNINICDNCTIGAGAVVTKNINQPGIYVGVPIRKL